MRSTRRPRAGLVEEIRALGQPPAPWDVAGPLFRRPLRAHRTPPQPRPRQSPPVRHPRIPRPGRHIPQELTAQRTFGVVLDTSGSVDTRLLAKARGAIASYADSRDVPAVRVVFCGAQDYDNGWMEPAEIAPRVRIRGRGGTVLQPRNPPPPGRPVVCWWSDDVRLVTPPAYAWRCFALPCHGSWASPAGSDLDCGGTAKGVCQRHHTDRRGQLR